MRWFPRKRNALTDLLALRSLHREREDTESTSVRTLQRGILFEIAEVQLHLFMELLRGIIVGQHGGQILVMIHIDSGSCWSVCRPAHRGWEPGIPSSAVKSVLRPRLSFLPHPPGLISISRKKKPPSTVNPPPQLRPGGSVCDVSVGSLTRAAAWEMKKWRGMRKG